MRRRRFLRIAAVAGSLSGIPLPERRITWRWRGSALGADASILLVHPERRRVAAIARAIAAEIDRLEQVFSLYRPESELVRLNRQGRLARPSADLVALLDMAQSIGSRTDGAFDVSVQPLWRLYAGRAGGWPDERSIERATKLVDYRAIEVAARRIALARPGMAITLNGIAQGYITDRITERLQDLGIADLLVDIGEIRAAGYRQDGHPWRVGIAGDDRRIALENAAIATSAPQGTLFEPSGRWHHLFDPASGRPSPHAAPVSVIAASAAIADATSTAAATVASDRRAELCRRNGAELLQRSNI